MPAWSTNLTSRVKHRPKIHLVDVALAAHLTNTSTDRMLAPTSSNVGALFESFVVNEVIKQLGWAETRARLFHFRDRSGPEVDMILESNDGRIVAIEVKAGQTVATSDAKWPALLRDRLGDRFVCGVVLHSGAHVLPLGDRLWSAPIENLWAASIGANPATSGGISA